MIPETKSQKYLASIGACKEGVELCGSQSLADAWPKTVRADFWGWLLMTSAGKAGWPSRAKVENAIQAAVITRLVWGLTPSEWTPEYVSKLISEAAHRGPSTPPEALKSMADILRREIGNIFALETLR